MTRDTPASPDRRDWFLAGGTALAAITLGGWMWRRGTGFDFEPVPALPGFRRLDAGATTRLYDPFIGLETPEDPLPNVTPMLLAGIAADPCAALYPGEWGSALPVAVFTDYNCPICRRSESDLQALADRSDGAIVLFWHELPLLGPDSLAAARAALAARKLGAYDAFRERLMRSRFTAEDAYLRSIAAAIDLNADAMIDAARSKEVTAEIARSLALAQLLGLPGTPGMVLGRTVVVGAPPPNRLERLARIEVERGMTDACAGA